MNKSLVILSGMVVSQSEATMEPKDPAAASFFAADARCSSRTVGREFLETTLLDSDYMGSFDCFAQDDKAF